MGSLKDDEDRGVARLDPEQDTVYIGNDAIDVPPLVMSLLRAIAGIDTPPPPTIQ